MLSQMGSHMLIIFREVVLTDNVQDVGLAGGFILFPLLVQCFLAVMHEPHLAQRSWPV